VPACVFITHSKFVKMPLVPTNFTYFLGIDFSKATIDLSLIDHTGQKLCKPFKVPNNAKGFAQLLVELERHENITKDNLMIIGEHTGRYCLLMAHLLIGDGWLFWLDNPTQIKKRIGIQKGKSDAKDAFQIAQYGRRYADEFVAYQPKTELLLQLDVLLKQYESCMRSYKSLMLNYKDTTQTLIDCDIALDEELVSSYQCQIDQLKSHMALLEKKMDALIQSDQKLNKQVKLVMSIPGIGRKTARNFALYTNGFTRLISAAELKSYCGVAPFVYESGTSVKKRSRVHPHANKRLKTLLHLGALSVIRYPGELQTYYNRKVAEGKNKMLVLNNIRAKLIDRIVAVIKRNTPYLKSSDDLLLS